MLIKREKKKHLFSKNWMAHICENLNSLHPGMVYEKLGWNWLSFPVEGDFKMFFSYCIFAIIFLVEKKTRATSFEFPFLEDALCQVWLKLAEWFWRRC